MVLPRLSDICTRATHNGCDTDVRGTLHLHQPSLAFHRMYNSTRPLPRIAASAPRPPVCSCTRLRGPCGHDVAVQRAVPAGAAQRFRVRRQVLLQPPVAGGPGGDRVWQPLSCNRLRRLQHVLFLLLLVRLCNGLHCNTPLLQITSDLNSKYDSRWHASRGVLTRNFPFAGGGSMDIIFVVSAAVLRGRCTYMERPSLFSFLSHDACTGMHICLSTHPQPNLSPAPYTSLSLQDTTPLILRYAGRPWTSFLEGWDTQDDMAIRSALQQQLNASWSAGGAARWRLVVGHHPVKSLGQHCQQVRGAWGAGPAAGAAGDEG